MCTWTFIYPVSLSHPPWKHLFDMLYGVTVKLITPSLEKLSDSKRPGPCECSNADVARRRKILYSTYMLHITTYIHGHGASTEKESEREADSFWLLFDFVIRVRAHGEQQCGIFAQVPGTIRSFLRARARASAPLKLSICNFNGPVMLRAADG